MLQVYEMDMGIIFNGNKSFKVIWSFILHTNMLPVDAIENKITSQWVISCRGEKPLQAKRWLRG